VRTFTVPIKTRRGHIEQVFDDLAQAGIARGELYAAWDFTVASAEGIAGRMLHIRNDAFAALGGAVTAVSTEWTRAVLGVPGMDYSTLLQRSSDFPVCESILEAAYPDELDRIVGFSLLQMLWDRSEANGYAHHMTDDLYPGSRRTRCSCEWRSATTRSRA